jgi:two-component system, LytTR family, sensor kinase
VTRVRRNTLLVLAAIALAMAGALLDAIVTDIADPWDRSIHSFGAAFPRLIGPWIILAAVCLGAVVVARRVPITRQTLLRALPVHALAAALLPVAHLSGVAALQGIVFHEVDPFSWRLGAMLMTYFAQDVLAYACVVGLVHAHRFRTEALAREKQALALQASLAESRLSALRAQLHPHFLFNTLNTAVMLVRDGSTKQAVNVLTDMSDLLRGVLNVEAHETALADELMLVRQYVRIEQERFHDRLDVRIDAGADVTHAMVPSFILQPLVENAIRHGVSTQLGAGRVSVCARRDAAQLVLEVMDDGHGSTNGARVEGQGIGLKNTRDRLEQLYGGAAQCALQPSANGTVVRVTLPYRTAFVGTIPSDGVH